MLAGTSQSYTVQYTVNLLAKWDNEFFTTCETDAQRHTHSHTHRVCCFSSSHQMPFPEDMNNETGFRVRFISFCSHKNLFICYDECHSASFSSISIKYWRHTITFPLITFCQPQRFAPQPRFLFSRAIPSISIQNLAKNYFHFYFLRVFFSAFSFTQIFLFLHSVRLLFGGVGAVGHGGGGNGRYAKEKC